VAHVSRPGQGSDQAGQLPDDHNRRGPEFLPREIPEECLLWGNIPDPSDRHNIPGILSGIPLYVCPLFLLFCSISDLT